MLEVERLLLPAKAYPAPGLQALPFPGRWPTLGRGAAHSVPHPHPTFHPTLGSTPSSEPSEPPGRKDSWVWSGQSQAPHLLDVLSPVTCYGEMSVSRHQGCSFTPAPSRGDVSPLWPCLGRWRALMTSALGKSSCSPRAQPPAGLTASQGSRQHPSLLSSSLAPLWACRRCLPPMLSGVPSFGGLGTSWGRAPCP